MDARAAPDGRRERGRSSRAVPIPRRWDQASLDNGRATEASKPGTPRRSRSSR